MTTVIVKFAPSKMLSAIMRYGTDWLDFDQSRRDEWIYGFSFETKETGSDAAEEAFDLTNNPSRQEEREFIYGRGRSMSVGDIAVVDGESWFCDRMGWKKLEIMDV